MPRITITLSEDAMRVLKQLSGNGSTSQLAGALLTQALTNATESELAPPPAWGGKRDK